ncbi:SRPBCC family protein [Micromonospora sp. WMMA1363]|uniref:type II toxin-antitoxin system Rv0910 family toxin n=1 Tax=Micromonospora sp. WMMA1363 TaxID=3053985 RepID=UPI00259CCDD3|nr:SRPBCC family protein [Micromonospora sp. WMMA1363]MDM4719428.1 SRPBCC family protein [Micromonospora sp. WMMA1363]
MPKVSVSAESTVEPEAVWRLAVDLPRYAEWLTMHEAFPGDIPATLAEGIAYRQRVKLMGMPAEMAWQVTTAVAPGRLELTGDGPMGVKAHNRFVIEPSGTGSQITFEMEFIGPALAGPMAGMLEKQAGTAARQSLDRFSALLA